MENFEREFEPKADLDIQLDKVEDDLLELWQENKIVREILEEFRMTRNGIEKVEGEAEQKNEKWHLLDRYRELLKTHQPKA